MQPNACTTQKIKLDMTATPPTAENSKAPVKKGDDLPPEILEIILPALKVGGFSALSGFTFGAFAGVVRSNTPTLFALASGVQWFTLGTSFWATRGFVLKAWDAEKVTSREKISASAIAGGVGGTFGGLLRGPRNVLPGAIMFSIFGAAGQALYNKADARNADSVRREQTKDLKDSWLNSKWSPMKVLSDREYEDMLKEKLLKINAEIALIDEGIEALRGQERDSSGRTVVNGNKLP